MATRLLCICRPRLDACEAGEFIFLASRQAWAFTNDARRSMTPHARFRAFIDRSEFLHHDHTGEHVTLEVCPWCGGDLPGVVVLTIKHPLEQADGSEDGG